MMIVHWKNKLNGSEGKTTLDELRIVYDGYSEATEQWFREFETNKHGVLGTTEFKGEYLI